MLAQLKDYLKTLALADHYYIGKIDNAQLKVLGVYSDGGVRVEAIGKNSSYEATDFRLLLHWNRNAKESEVQANTLYETIRYIHEVTMTDIYVAFIDLEKPIFVGTDDNNVYEYVINGTLYYGR